MRLLSQRFLALFRPDFRAYQDGYSRYERLASDLGLTLLGPDPEQTALAKQSPLIQEIDDLYTRAESASLAARMPFNVACVLYQKGLLRRLVGEYQEAEGFFRRSLSAFEAVLAEHASARKSISMCHFYLGQALLRQGNYSDAAHHLQTAIALDEAIGDDARIASAREMLSTCQDSGSR